MYIYDMCMVCVCTCTLHIHDVCAVCLNCILTQRDGLFPELNYKGRV